MTASIGSEIADALSFAFGMFWEILWALILGFLVSGAVQAVVSKREMRRLLPDDAPRSLAIACGLGAVILCGVTIGEDAMVGAGCVVTKDVAPGEVVAGVPARALRSALVAE